jgi:hypothetical protein
MENAMSQSFEAAPAAARNRSIEARRAARQVKAGRDERIIGLLNRGVSIPEIADREGVTEKRMRALVAEILARRMPQPPAEFVALQVGRLHEALNMAYDSMSQGNLRALDRVVKIVRELDRYHGFVAARAPRVPRASGLAAGAQRPPLDENRHPQWFLDHIRDRMEGRQAPYPQELAAKEAAAAASALNSPAEAAPAVESPPTSPDMAPQALEKPESAPGNGLAPEGSIPNHPDQDRGETARSPLDAPGQNPIPVAAPPTSLETAPEGLENIQFAPGDGMAPESASPPEWIWVDGGFCAVTRTPPISARSAASSDELNGVMVC